MSSVIPILPLRVLRVNVVNFNSFNIGNLPIFYFYSLNSIYEPTTTCIYKNIAIFPSYVEILKIVIQCPCEASSKVLFQQYQAGTGGWLKHEKNLRQIFMITLHKGM